MRAQVCHGVGIDCIGPLLVPINRFNVVSYIKPKLYILPAFPKAAVASFWRGVALINGVGLAAATEIDVEVAVATGVALGVAAAIGVVGFGVSAGVETGATTAMEGVGVTSSRGPEPPRRIEANSTRPIISAPT
jgi:hypothetical protein